MNKNIFCFTIIVIIIILIDLVFNFSKRLFRSFEGFAYQRDQMKSLVNILDGTTISIEQIGSTNTYYIPIFDKEDRVLGLDTNNELVIREKTPKNAWTLIKYKVDEDNTDTFLKDKIGDFGLSADKLASLETLDLYLLINSNKTYAIQYIRNSLVCTPIDIAINLFVTSVNMWKLHNGPGPSKELVLRDIKQSYLGPVKYSSEIGDPDKINIKLNIQDENLKKILNINNGNNVLTDSNTDGETEKCDTWLSKDAVRSLCPGCVN